MSCLGTGTKVGRGEGGGKSNVSKEVLFFILYFLKPLITQLLFLFCIIGICKHD